MSENAFSIIDLMVSHEIQLHKAIIKKEWKVASKIIYAMSQLIPAKEPAKVCKEHHRQLNDYFYCADHGRTLNEDEYT